MNANTQSITIHAAPAKVVDFVARPENLPRWAVGFAKSVRRDGADWLVQTGGGEIPLRVEHSAGAGTVDFRFAPGGVEALAAARALPNGDGSEFVFTQFQADGMSDEDFARSVAAVHHELAMLRAVLEVECPL